MRNLAFALLAACSGSSAATSPDATPDSPAPDADPCATSVTARPGTVLTTRGPVTGTLEGAVYAWKGIPYAAPPTGDLRWQPPAQPACWTDERMTTAFGAQCPQLDTSGNVVGDEDCLTLNVWAPATASSAQVMVFIHGGGNVQGSASDALYDGAQLAQQTGAVVVTLDYRLGALGFFANAALDAESSRGISGNYGILDQIAALQWVHDNIAGFGGAPAHVMLFGESAGGQDTLVHVASPLSVGLFSSALVESGGAYKNTLAQYEPIVQPVVDAVGCTGSATLAACLRAVPAATLAAIPSALGPLSSGMRYEPVVDGYLLTDLVPAVIAQGAPNQVPLVLGTNADETSKMVPRVTTDADYQAAVSTLYGAAAPQLLQIYPSANYASPQKALVRMTTDVTWTCPMRRLARSASAAQTAPVYRYHFSWKAPGNAGQLIGATHGIELPFVFGTFATINGYTPSASDLAFASAVDGYWSSFGATGIPAGTPAWPRYDAASDPYLELDSTITTGAGLATSQCDQMDAAL
jgi:para-nitrobenzyl esterase